MMESGVMLSHVLATGEREIGPECWSGFTPATAAEVEKIECELSITLPADFKEFYLNIGWGEYPNVGWIDSPADLVQEPYMPIYYLTGSMVPDAEWASLKEHNEFWLSNGQKNPAPEYFTGEKLSLDGVMLWDLLSIGTNPCGGMYHIYVGSDSPSYRYCMIYQCNIDFKESSFYEGMLRGFESLSDDT